MFRGSATLILVASLFVATSCVPEGLAFVQDTRLDIVAPEDRDEVTLPVTVEWEVEDFEITGPDGSSTEDAGSFAVFLDRSPVAPGERLAAIARHDTVCQSTPGCPDKTYLSDHYTYETTDTEFTFKQLPDQDLATGRETHEVTIILLDGTGHRIGESAWYVTVFYDREDD